MPGVTRREFLKLFASAGVVALAGMAGLSIPPNRTGRANIAEAQSAGSWKSGPVALNHPVHLALLPSGKVLYLAGSGFHRPSANGPFKAGLWDPATGIQKEFVVDKDIWCAGHTLLPNGNVLIMGGTIRYPHLSPNNRWWGLNATYEFDFKSESFAELPPMAHGRWYPTAVILGDGRVQVVEGFDEFGYNNLLNEIFDPITKSWTIVYDPNRADKYCVGCDETGCANVPGAGQPCYGGAGIGVNPWMQVYPRMHLLPSGLVAVVGQKLSRYLWNPVTGRWYYAGKGVNRSFGTSVLLPLENTATEKGKILACGGSNTAAYPAVARKTAEIIEQSNLRLVTRSIQSMTYPRRYLNPVILPNGKLIVVGGTRENNDQSLAVYNPEMFDPVTEKWTVLPKHSIPRIYHSGALLLADGRVLVAGTSYSQYKYELRTEIYSPPYISAVRPAISSVPSTILYGLTFDISTPNASSISSVSLLRHSSTTHHYNTDQRLLWLQITSRTSNKVTVSAPINENLAPPGYYLVHLLNGSGIPSKGKALQVL